jgi:hypothetical protein
MPVQMCRQTRHHGCPEPASVSNLNNTRKNCKDPMQEKSKNRQFLPAQCLKEFLTAETRRRGDQSSF